MADVTAVKVALGSNDEGWVMPGPLYAKSEDGSFYKHWKTHYKVDDAQVMRDDIMRAGGLINPRFWKRVYKRSE